MGDRAIARRYAAAFIALAQETGDVDKLGEDLGRSLELMEANDGQLYRALSNPVFTAEERKGVLAKVAPIIRLLPLTRNLLNLMLDNGRFSLLRDVAAVYSDMADDDALEIALGAKRKLGSDLEHRAEQPAAMNDSQRQITQPTAGGLEIDKCLIVDVESTDRQ